MIFRAPVVILFIAFLTNSCDNRKFEENKSEDQAIHIILVLDTSTLHFLNDWDYTERGKTNFWSRLSEDSTIFNCSFYPSVDTPKLSTYQVGKFLNYFKSNLKIDTIYHEIRFIKISDTSLNLIGVNNYGQDISLSKNISLINIFPEQNPFEIFVELTNLRDSINVIGIRHYNAPGKFIEFYMPDGQHILTYVPDSLLYSPNLNRFWKGEFSKGKQIERDWNFRKLENPIDGG